MNSLHQAQLLKSARGQMMDTASLRARRVRQVLSVYRNRRILDVGCDAGHLLAPIARRNEVYGIDLSPNVFEATRRGYRGAHCGNIEERTPFYTAEFDIVFAGECIEHIPDTDGFLSEVRRILKPNGKFILNCPNIRTLQSIGVMLFCNLPPRAAASYTQTAHFRDWTTRLLQIALIKNRFKIDWIEGVYFTGFLPRIARFFPSLASTIILQCSKD